MMIAKVRNCRVGDPKDPKTDQGPQVDKLQFDKIMKLIQTGKQDASSGKCKLLIGGGRVGNVGY